jgi:hypothetical protein
MLLVDGHTGAAIGSVPMLVPSTEHVHRNVPSSQAIW